MHWKFSFMHYSTCSVFKWNWQRKRSDYCLIKFTSQHWENAWGWMHSFLRLILQFNLAQTSSLPCFAPWVHHIDPQNLVVTQERKEHVARSSNQEHYDCVFHYDMCFSFYIGLKDSQTEEAKFVSLLICKEQHCTRLQRMLCRHICIWLWMQGNWVLVEEGVCEWRLHIIIKKIACFPVKVMWWDSYTACSKTNYTCALYQQCSLKERCKLPGQTILWWATETPEGSTMEVNRSIGMYSE